MRLLYLTVGILLILLNVNNCLTRKTPRKPNVSKKPSRIPKASPPSKPGQLFYKGSQHSIQLNQTDEYQIYAANYSMFPDSLYYPRTADRDIEEFLTACMNTTLELDINSARLLKLRNSGELYMKVATHVIEFLCLENYYRQPNRAQLPSGGLWEALIATVILYVLKRLG